MTETEMRAIDSEQGPAAGAAALRHARRRTDHPTTDHVLAVKPKKATEMLGCGITRLYELINGGELESFKDGRSRKITVASIHAYIGRRVAASARSTTV